MNHRAGVALAFILLLGPPGCSLVSRRSATPSIDLARSFLAAADTSAAEAILRRLIEKPDNADPFILLGEIFRNHNTIRDRLLSQQILERAASLFPQDPGVLQALGETYYAQGFYADAERCFRRAVSLDSTLCQAYYMIGKNRFRKWKRNRGYRDELEEGVRALQKAARCDPLCRACLHLGAKSLFVLGRRLECFQFVEQLLSRWPDDPVALALKGALSFELQDYQRCRSSFERWLASVGQEERESILDISPLLPEKEAQLYRTCSEERKQEMRRRFWLSVDPDPTTAINERFLEHLYRNVLAEVNFGGEGVVRGADTHRGLALIKFGVPASISFDLGSQLGGRMEIWRYSLQDFAFTLIFADEFLNDNFTIPIVHGDMYEMLTYLPPATSLPHGPPSPPGLLGLFAFKDTPVSCSLYLAAKVDADTTTLPADERLPDEIGYRAVLFDREFKEEKRTTGRARLLGEKEYSLLTHWQIPFERYRCVLTIDQGRGTRTVLEGWASTARFLTDSLVLSDLILFEPGTRRGGAVERGRMKLVPNIERAYRLGRRLGVYFEAYNLKLRRHRADYEVSYQIRPQTTRSLWARFTGLLRGLMGTARAAEPVISQTFHRVSETPTAGEYLVIDISSLPPGQYSLTVAVLDKTSWERAGAQESFSVILP